MSANAAARDRANSVRGNREFATPILAVFGQVASRTWPEMGIDPLRAVVLALTPAEKRDAPLSIWEISACSGPISVGVDVHSDAIQVNRLERSLHSLPIASGRVSMDLGVNGFSAVRPQP